ncbi:hypothetical protein [Streptomyces antarcticus]|uniref:hypothetical protein n=1 Tax=Streptomyces antarcticus TaxID=2996458 RepID=UPI002271F2AB|nr:MULTISPECIES: hypothetical protein [unclassified Streptomyces]MCY0947078.1 hypothetical protein [Streptomyces sp. H34-AA3]MCZ4084009.1 hypothetical protein [Streptomyces sp. H34-S5]
MSEEATERRSAGQRAEKPSVEEQALTAFLKRIEALAVPTGGGAQQMNIEAFQELVASDPERTASACRHLLDKAKARTGTWHAFAQLAVVMAALYDRALDDDTLTEWVETELDAAGITVGQPEVIPPEQDAEPADEKPLLFAVPPDRVEAGDIYPFVVTFSVRAQGMGPERIAELKRLRGRFVVTFDVPDSDPRAVWEIPKIRSYVAELSEQMPYLPYYFKPQDRGSLFMWLACLAPTHACSECRLNLDDDDVVTHTAWSMYATRTLAEALGDDPDEVCAGVFAPLPPPFTARITSLVEQFPEDFGHGR